MKFDHIGIATANINETLEFMQQVFQIKDISEKVYDSNQNGTLCMVTLNDNTRIELVEGNVVKNLVKKNRNLYHTCYKVDNIEKEIEKLQQLNALLITPAKETVLFNGRRVAFLMTNIGLIELLEDKENI